MSFRAIIIVAAATILPAQAQQAPSAPIPSSASEPKSASAMLPGRWVRPDGGYVITIKSVDANGMLDASYTNPNPLPFQIAVASYGGGALQILLELRAGGYNGSTYKLSYDGKSDQLRGTYYQAVANQTFEVFFVRK